MVARSNTNTHHPTPKMRVSLALAAALAVAASAPALVRADAATASASADLASTASLRGKVLEAITAEASAHAAAHGVQNCYTKCAYTFDNTAYSINSQQDQYTYEYQACKIGCDICTQQLANANSHGGDCYTTCKNTNFLDMTDAQGNPVQIVKGVVEPDKACMFGCVINLCQVVCSNGTPDNWSKANANLWWQGTENPNLGCTIKTGFSRPDGFYAMSSQYNYWNSPSGSGGQAGCCSNGMNLCKYPANSKLAVFKNSMGQAKKQCANVVGMKKPLNYKNICAWVSDASNCGSSTVTTSSPAASG